MFQLIILIVFSTRIKQLFEIQKTKEVIFFSVDNKETVKLSLLY